MRRVTATLFTLIAVGALAVGGIGSALALPAGPAASALFLASATAAVAAGGLATRIMVAMEQHAKSRNPQ